MGVRNHANLNQSAAITMDNKYCDDLTENDLKCVARIGRHES